MKTHFAWRPHLDRDALFNPFIPSERQSPMGHVNLSDAWGDDTQTAAETLESGPAEMNTEAAAAPLPDSPDAPDPKTE